MHWDRVKNKIELNAPIPKPNIHSKPYPYYNHPYRNHQSCIQHILKNVLFLCLILFICYLSCEERRKKLLFISILKNLLWIRLFQGYTVLYNIIYSYCTVCCSLLSQWLSFSGLLDQRFYWQPVGPYIHLSSTVFSFTVKSIDILFIHCPNHQQSIPL